MVPPARTQVQIPVPAGTRASQTKARTGLHFRAPITADPAVPEPPLIAPTPLARPTTCATRTRAARGGTTWDWLELLRSSQALLGIAIPGCASHSAVCLFQRQLKQGRPPLSPLSLVAGAGIA